MSYQGHRERAVFEVCDLGKTNIIIGYTWLQKHNLVVDWKTGNVEMTHCPRECNMFVKEKKKEMRLGREKMNPQKYSVTMEEIPDEEMPNGEKPIMIEELGKDDRDDLVHIIRGGQSWDPNPKVIDKPVEEWVPKQYHNYLFVFQKEDSERMPLRKPWDHVIDMKADFQPRKSKVHPLSPQEQEEVDSFLKEQI
jgi:hypothetical protein